MGLVASTVSAETLLIRCIQTEWSCGTWVKSLAKLLDTESQLSSRSQQPEQNRHRPKPKTLSSATTESQTSLCS
jgi:hypothetical protein